MRAVRFIVALFALVGVFVFAGTALAQDEPDCDNYPSQAAAQAVFNQDPYNDPFGLDGPIGPAFAGVQYLACEGNPAPFALPFDPTGNQVVPTPAPTSAPGASVAPQPGLPATGASDTFVLVGMMAALGMFAAGVASHKLVRDRA